MTGLEAMDFFDKHVQGRFSKWEPESAEIDDWLFYLKGLDEDVALRAIREHKSESRYNTPALSTFRAKARGFMPPKEHVEKPEDTVFIWYDGGGDTTLQSGYFFPVVVVPKEQHLIMKAAENAKRRREETYGGEWKIFQNTTGKEMVRMRCDLRAIEVNANWKKIKDIGDADRQKPVTNKKELIDVARQP